MKIIIVFKNLFSLTVTCEEFNITRNGLGCVVGYEFNGIKDRKPLFINVDDVICVYRNFEAEEEDE